MNFAEVKKALEGTTPEEGLRWVATQFGDAARFSTSLGMEDQVIAYWIGSMQLPIKVFTLDTGRLFPETYDILELTRTKYKLPIDVYFPDTSGVEKLVKEKGPNSFYLSVDNRKECCHIRKVVPLNRALAGTAVWITGIRAEQSNNRQSMALVEWDDAHKLIKYNPLLHWSLAETEHYIKDKGIPVNSLHKKGFVSIGCAPCTRAIAEGEDQRAGRWWWETSARECGLHEHNAIQEPKRTSSTNGH